MPHLSPDFKTKKALKEALTAGKAVYAFQPGGIFPMKAHKDGKGNLTATIEAPADYHKWYGVATVTPEFRVLTIK